jgi:putative chitinase
MAAELDRAVFFQAVRLRPFPGSLTAGQVSGMEAILDACPPDTPTDHLAYAFGTCPIETGWTMQPVKEKGGAAYYTRMYDIAGPRPAKAKELGNTKPGDGALFCGRGLLQLTGRSNYRRATSRLRDLGMMPLLTDLEQTPDFAMDPDIASAILFVGMREGWFTGKKLADYFGAGRADWTGARRIINGQDRAAEIGQHAQGFRAALIAAGHRPGAVAASVPTTSVETKPLAPVPAGPLIAPAPRNSGASPAAAPRADDTTVVTGSLGGWLATKLSRIWNS